MAKRNEGYFEEESEAHSVNSLSRNDQPNPIYQSFGTTQSGISETIPDYEENKHMNQHGTKFEKPDEDRPNNDGIGKDETRTVGETEQMNQVEDNSRQKRETKNDDENERNEGKHRSETTSSASNEVVLRINEKDEAKDATTKRDCRKYLTHAAYMLYFCMFALNNLLAYQYVYDRMARLSPFYLNITRGHWACAVNRSHDVTVAWDEAQTRASRWMLFLSIADGLTGMFAVMILGSNSDRFGRRILFILPNTGLVIKMVIYGLNSRLDLPIEMLFAAHLCDGSCGFFVTMLVGASTCAADVTSSSKSRTVLVVLVNILCSCAMGLASLSSGYLITSTGFSTAFFIAAGILAANYIPIFTMRETLPPGTTTKSTLEYIKHIFQFYFRKSMDNRRLLYDLMMLAFLLATLVFVGRGAIDTLYFKSAPFCWTSMDIGHFSGIVYLVHPFLALASVVVLQKVMSDAGIGVVVAIVAVSGFVVEGLATGSVLLYVGGMLQYPWILVAALIKSMVSKLTPAHQQGAAQSSLAVVESAVSLVGGVLFNAIYEATLTVYRGSIYFLMAALLLLCALTYGVLGCLMRGRTDRLSMSIREKPEPTSIQQTS